MGMCFEDALKYMFSGEWVYRRGSLGWYMKATRKVNCLQFDVRCIVEEDDAEEEAEELPETWLTKEDIEATDWEVIGGP